MSGERSPLASAAGDVVVILAAAAIVSAVFATPFVRDPTRLPFGRDTAGYVWRAAVAQDLGLPALRGEPAGFGDRPGHPSVVAVLRSMTGQDGLEAAWLLPVVMAAALALGAGGAVAAGAGGTRSATVAAAVGVGGSAFIAWTAVGYAANLMFDVVAIGFCLVVLHAMRGGSGSVVAAALLFAGGTAIHWVFALALATVVGAVVIVFELWPERRTDASVTGPGRRPRRPTVVLAAALVAGAAAVAASPELPSGLPRVEPEHIANFVSLRLAGFHLPIVAGIAAVGLVLGIVRRRALWDVGLLASWAMPAAVGLLAWSAFDQPTPPYRWIGFALGLPFLASLAGPWLVERLPLGTALPSRGLAFGLGAIPAAVLLVWGAQVWWGRTPLMQPTAFAELATVSSYLESSVPQGTPVLLSIRPERPPRATVLNLRAGLPGSRAVDAATIGLRYDRGLQERLDASPGAVILHLDSFRPRPPPTGTELGPGVWLLRGPAPDGRVVAGVEPRSLGAGWFTAMGAAWLITLGSAGSGWTGGMNLSVVERVGAAPACGIASIAVTALLAARLGIRPDGWGAFGIWATATAAGWAVTAIGWVVRRPAG